MGGTEFAIALAAFLLVWYFAGLYLGRRRAAALIRQIRDSLELYGGRSTIRWFGRSAFRIEIEFPAAPFKRVGVSLVLEPRETFLLWLVWRCFGRRDWLMAAASVDGGAKGIFDVYHPRRRGSQDSINEVRALGWTAEPFPGRPPLLYAAPGREGRELACSAMALLQGLEIWQLRVRHKEPQLVVGLPVPADEKRVPLPILGLLPRLVECVTTCGGAEGAGG